MDSANRAQLSAYRKGGANRRGECEIIQERQIEFRRAYISSGLDLKISSAAIIIPTGCFKKAHRLLSLIVLILFSHTILRISTFSSFSIKWSLDEIGIKHHTYAFRKISRHIIYIYTYLDTLRDKMRQKIGGFELVIHRINRAWWSSSLLFVSSDISPSSVGNLEM